MTELIYKCISNNPCDTENFGKIIAEYILENKADLIYENKIFVALYGDVGAGKTVFVRGLASILTPDEFVSSPTYTLVNEYNGIIKICHYDMYRITDENDLESTGFYDYKNCIIAAEWCENTQFAIPDKHIKINIDKLDDGITRKLTAERVFI